MMTRASGGRGATVSRMSSGTHLPTLPLTNVLPGDGAQRRALVGRARQLTYLGLAWHALEAGVAFAAGVVAGSIALVGFRADSVIEAAAGLVLLWLVSGERVSSHRAERRAQQLISASFVLLAVYVTVGSVSDLIGGHHHGGRWR